jgi:hypothetical protein
MAYPSPAPARTVHVVRVPVAVLVPLAVVAVVGLLVWGGGDTPEYASAGGSSDFGSGFAGSGSDSATAGGGATPSAVPLAPSQAIPAGGLTTAPTQSGAVLAWRVARAWPDQLSAYQAIFPMPGYRLGEQRITSSDGGGAWDIEADQPGPQVAVGLLYIGPDPADPTSTIVEIEVY